MLYLVTPDREVKWTPGLGQNDIDFARTHSQDLALYDWWEDAETRANDSLVRVALVHGIACSAGIVVDSRHLVEIRRPKELRQSLEAGGAVSARTRPYLPTGDLNATAEAPSARASPLPAAHADTGVTLANSDPRPDLIDHWVSIGGTLPEPS